MAGEAALARGADYAASGAVTIVSADAEGIDALVQGSDAYRVRLRGDGSDLGGDCTCPARERDGWCKHLVAVALVANATGEAMPDRRRAIRRHLVSLGPDALAGMLLDLAERDTALLRRLDLAASAATTPAAVHAARQRQELRHALRPRDSIGYSEAAGWVEEVLEALGLVTPLIALGAAAARHDAKTAVDHVALLVVRRLHDFVARAEGPAEALHRRFTGRVHRRLQGDVQ